MRIKKLVQSRLKITKNKKVVRRKAGQSHFLSKKSSKQIKRKKQPKRSDYLIKNVFKKPGTL